MATPAQITANRANAQKSTGPISPEGKSASRFNALKHGLDAASVIIPGEDPAAYDALAADYRAEWDPATPSDNFHVDTMIRADWQKRRLQPLETELYKTILAETPGATLVAALLSGTPAAKLLTRIQRQILAFERAWYRASSQLQRARLDAQAAEKQALEFFLNRTASAPPLPELASFPAIPPARPVEPAANPALRL
jgi:hypothetical protein